MNTPREADKEIICNCALCGAPFTIKDDMLINPDEDPCATLICSNCEWQWEEADKKERGENE